MTRLRRCALVLATSACGDPSSEMLRDAPPGEDAAPCGPAVDGWSTAPAVIGGAIQETAAVALDGKLYVLGGFDGNLGVVSDVRIYDPASCTWSLGPALPRAVHHANATVVDDAIYVLGAMESLSFTAIGDVWRWRPAGDAGWESRAAMPVGSQRGSAVTGAIGSTVVVAGGLGRGALVTVSAYDTAADTWTDLPPLPAPRDHGCGGVVNDTLYVIGGRQGDLRSNTATVFAYTLGGAWTMRAPMPTPRGGIGCAVVDDTFIVVGGEGNAATESGVFAEVERYAPAGDRWDALPPMPTPRHGMGVAALDGVLYVPGGATQEAFGAVATHEQLRPSSQ